MKQYFSGFFTAICLSVSFVMFTASKNDNLGDITVNSIRVIDNQNGGFITTYNDDGEITAYIGSRASIDVSNDLWYTSLNKSDLNPPGYVFGIVWPILYILMMVSAFISYKKVFIVFNT